MLTDIQELCALCLETINFSKHEMLTEKLMEKLNILQIQKLSLNHTGDSKICNMCLEKVQDAFDFRMTCLDKVNTQMTSGTTQVVNKSHSENLKVCRLCNHFVSANLAISLLKMLEKQSMMEAFEKYLPGINLEAIHNPIICKSCQTSLNNYSNFLFLLSGLNTSYVENVYNDHLVNFKDHSILVSDTLNEKYKIEIEYMDSVSASANLNDCGKNVEDTVKVTEVKIKEETVDEDILTDNNFALCDVRHIKTKLEEDTKIEHDIVDIKNEMESDDEIIGGEIYEEVTNKDVKYANLQLTNDVQIKGESEASWINGSGAIQIYNGNTGDQIATVHRSDESNIKIKAVKPYGKNHTLSYENVDKIKMYKCQQCTYQTKFRSSLKYHVLTHKNVDELDMHKCQQCSYQTKFKHSLTKHMIVHKNCDEIEMHKCHQCSFETKFKSCYKNHMIIHKRPDEVEMHACQQCTYQTKFKGYLKKHMLTHKNLDEIETQKCEQCSFRSKCKSNLRKHMLIHKNPDEIEMHKCQQCTYQSKYKKQIKCHMLIHKNLDDTVMYKCEQCIFQSRYKATLKTHTLIHKSFNETEMHKCQQCTFKSKYKSSLKQHILIHKTPNEVEINRCQQCPYETKYKGNMKSHMVFHKNSNEVEMHKCPQCTYQSKYRKQITRHMAIHKDSD